MLEVYAVLLLHSAKQPVSEDNIKNVLKKIGAQVDEARIKALVASLEGQDIDKLIQEAVVVAPAASAEEKKEEKKPEEEKAKAEEAAAGLSMLFG